MRSPLVSVFVAEIEGKIIGFAGGGPSREPLAAYDAELYTIYLLEEIQGRGIGKDLLSAVAEALVGKDHTRTLLWVPEHWEHHMESLEPIYNACPEAQIVLHVGGTVRQLSAQPFHIEGPHREMVPERKANATARLQSKAVAGRVESRGRRKEAVQGMSLSDKYLAEEGDPVMCRRPRVTRPERGRYQGQINSGFIDVAGMECSHVRYYTETPP
jgi:Acetyltransferase (GNAT) family